VNINTSTKLYKDGEESEHESYRRGKLGTKQKTLAYSSCWEENARFMAFVCWTTTWPSRRPWHWCPILRPRLRQVLSLMLRLNCHLTPLNTASATICQNSDSSVSRLVADVICFRLWSDTYFKETSDRGDMVAVYTRYKLCVKRESNWNAPDVSRSQGNTQLMIFCVWEYWNKFCKQSTKMENICQ
jgi:hypothetical protein